MCIMIHSFLKFTFCSFVATTWVLSVPALHLEPRSRVCRGLMETRTAKSNRYCTNPNNVFTYQTSPQARIGGTLSPSGLTCGEEFAMPAQLCAHCLPIFRPPARAGLGQQRAGSQPLRPSACRSGKNNRTKEGCFVAYHPRRKRCRQ